MPTSIMHAASTRFKNETRCPKTSHEKPVKVKKKKNFHPVRPEVLGNFANDLTGKLP
jgi:hypothetical protein